MTESLCCPPETITILLTGYTPIQNKKFKNKKENKLSVKKLLKRGTWGETPGWSHAPHQNFTFSSRKLLDGRKWRLNKPHPSPTSQHFGSDQESLTSLQATNPAGRRQPGAGNNSHSHTDITEPHTVLTRLGDGKAPEHGDCHSSSGLHQSPCPDDHRSGESMLQFNMFKRSPLFPRRLCSPNIMYFNANPSGLPKSVTTEQMLGFFKAKSLTGTVMVSSGVSLAGPVSSDSTKHWSWCCREGSLWMLFTSFIRS